GYVFSRRCFLPLQYCVSGYEAHIQTWLPDHHFYVLPVAYCSFARPAWLQSGEYFTGATLRIVIFHCIFCIRLDHLPAWLPVGEILFAGLDRLSDRTCNAHIYRPQTSSV